MKRLYAARLRTRLKIELFFAMVLLSCNSSNSNVNNQSPVKSDSLITIQTHNDTLDHVVGYLLDASARDFHDHQPPVPVDFRHVQIRYFAGKNYLICGEFLTLNQNKREDWVEFTTIKTSQYEQWIGSTTYCQNSKVISYKISDLSAALKSRFDSLQHAGK